MWRDIGLLGESLSYEDAHKGRKDEWQAWMKWLNDWKTVIGYISLPAFSRLSWVCTAQSDPASFAKET